ncbi:hypothetical protein CGMCC3_g9533 [Colletotrichum fructicola]|uniref:Uncharacterized protein n=1 Tax=Colletotrichum fructicola (strain Nara gc5) TaxID=1213859 RepID=L2G541_COLFN|nr:uncharacterized protein CGMCC3_g9533 [Colletotrichum fructicola]KAE9574343.1 hypothetical protein CGMCC3_g9533 [Colletotrichum fructicola]KAF4473918.1 hypothetical protein CGGC5_v016618 [Colletotrichum fructicola Nara gc5]
MKPFTTLLSILSLSTIALAAECDAYGDVIWTTYTVTATGVDNTDAVCAELLDLTPCDDPGARDVICGGLDGNLEWTFTVTRQPNCDLWTRGFWSGTTQNRYGSVECPHVSLNPAPGTSTSG